MDKTTAIVIVTAILAVVFISFFLLFRNRGRGKLKGPFGTGLDGAGSNEAQPTTLKNAQAGGNVRLSESGGRGVLGTNIKVGGDIDISSSAPTATPPPKR